MPDARLQRAISGKSAERLHDAGDLAALPPVTASYAVTARAIGDLCAYDAASGRQRRLFGIPDPLFIRDQGLFFDAIGPLSKRFRSRSWMTRVRSRTTRAPSCSNNSAFRAAANPANTPVALCHVGRRCVALLLLDIFTLHPWAIHGKLAEG